MEFLICEKCGNLTAIVRSSGVRMVCCGQNMTKLTPKTEEEGTEKHLPVIEEKNGIVTVRIGREEHPFSLEHHIEWIALETIKGVQRKYVSPGQKPYVSFAITEDDHVFAAYAYCNLHGLWKTEKESLYKKGK